MQEKKKMKLWKKITIITLSTILGIILILGIVIFSVWNKEIRSVFSINLLVEAKEDNNSGPVYEMDMVGDYYFLDFLENGGASNDQELIDHIVDNMTKGIIPITIKAPTIGCSSFTAVTPEGKRLFGRNYDFTKMYDVICSTLTFMHIQDKEYALTKIFSLLKQDGKAVLSIDKNQQTYINTGYSRITIFPDTPNTICGLLRQIGFSNIEVKEIEFAHIISCIKN